MPEPEYVRVLDKTTGHKLSLIASSVAADPDPYEVLDEPAVGIDGVPVAPEHAVTAPSQGDLTALYLKRTKTDLEDEVRRRNDDGRLEDALIVVNAPGNKPELAAALVADDTNKKENVDA